MSENTTTEGDITPMDNHAAGGVEIKPLDNHAAGGKADLNADELEPKADDAKEKIQTLDNHAGSLPK
jgi:hypothetical protein